MGSSTSTPTSVDELKTCIRIDVIPGIFTSAFKRFEMTVAYCQSTTLQELCDKAIEMINSNQITQYEVKTIMKQSFANTEDCHVWKTNNNKWQSLMSKSIIDFSKKEIIEHGFVIHIEIKKFVHKINGEQNISCPHMLQDGKNDPFSCPTYIQMMHNYNYTKENLHHLHEFTHFKYELNDKPACKYGVQCKAFLRSQNKRNRLDDECHVQLYRHPTRTRKRKQSTSTLLDSLEPPQLQQYTKDETKKHKKCLFDSDYETNALMEEVIKNGFKKELFLTDSDMQKEYSITSIVEQKLKHRRHQLSGSSLTRVEMLALILYTRGDCGYDLCKSQRQGDYNKWKCFDLHLWCAIARLSKKEELSPALYIGLSGGKLDNTVSSGYFSTYRSSTWNKSMIGQKGIEICMDKTITNEMFISCDVSWISMFPDECEVLIARSVYGLNYQKYKLKPIQTADAVQTVMLQPIIINKKTDKNVLEGGETMKSGENNDNKSDNCFIIQREDSNKSIHVSSYHISCKSNMNNFYGLCINVGIVLYEYKNQSEWYLNGIHCKCGYIYLCKMDNSTFHEQSTIASTCFKKLFGVELDDKATGASFVCTNWKYNSKGNGNINIQFGEWHNTKRCTDEREKEMIKKTITQCIISGCKTCTLVIRSAVWSWYKNGQWIDYDMHTNEYIEQEYAKYVAENINLNETEQESSYSINLNFGDFSRFNLWKKGQWEDYDIFQQFSNKYRLHFNCSHILLDENSVNSLRHPKWKNDSDDKNKYFLQENYAVKKYRIVRRRNWNCTGTIDPEESLPIKQIQNEQKIDDSDVLSEISEMLDHSIENIGINTDADLNAFKRVILNQDLCAENADNYSKKCPNGNSNSTKQSNNTSQQGNNENQNNNSSESNQNNYNQHAGGNNSGGGGRKNGGNGRDDKNNNNHNNKQNKGKDNKKKKNKKQQKPEEISETTNVDEENANKSIQNHHKMRQIYNNSIVSMNVLNHTTQLLMNETVRLHQRHQQLYPEHTTLQSQPLYNQSTGLFSTTNANVNRSVYASNNVIVNNCSSCYTEEKSVKSHSISKAISSKGKRKKTKKKANRRKSNNGLEYHPSKVIRVRGNVFVSRQFMEEIESMMKEEISDLDLYNWIDINTAMQHNDNKYKQGTEFKVINLDLHQKLSGENLYAVIRKNTENGKLPWVMTQLFTKKEVMAEFDEIDIPIPSRANWLFQQQFIQHRNDIKMILASVEKRSQLITKTKWCKVPVFSAINNKRRLTLCITNLEFKKDLKVNLLDNNYCIGLIPILMFNQDSHRVEYILVATIGKRVNIGISLIYNRGTVEVTGIHISKNDICRQHGWISSKHIGDCGCLSDFSNDVNNLVIGNPDTAKNKIKDLEKRNHEWKNRAIHLEEENGILKHQNAAVIARLNHLENEMQKLKKWQSIIHQNMEVSTTRSVSNASYASPSTIPPLTDSISSITTPSLP